MNKYLVLFVVGLLLTGKIFAQGVSFPVYYKLALNKSKDGSDETNHVEDVLYTEYFVDDQNRRLWFSFTKTKFSNDELTDLYKRFIKHLETSKQVKTYSQPQYTAGIQNFDPDQIKALENPSLYKRNGNYFLELTGGELKWTNGKGKGPAWMGDISLDYNSVLQCDTMRLQRPYPPYETIDTVGCSVYEASNLHGTEFTEIWNFSSKTGTFTKKVEFMGIYGYAFSRQTYEYLGTIPLINFQTQSKTDSKNLLKENMVYDVAFDQWNSCGVNYPCIYCSSVTNLVANETSTNHYISPENRTVLYLEIFKAVENGKLEAFSATDFEAKTEKKLTPDEVYSLFSKAETLSVQMPYPPYDYQDTIIVTYFSNMDIMGIRFVEDWFLEPKKFNFHKKVKVFALLTMKYSDYGEILGYAPLVYFRRKE